MRVGSIREDETRAHARSRTGSHRVRGGCSTIEKHGHERTRVSACGELERGGAAEAPEKYSLARCVRELQREESNLREDRLTAGCLTIRLRWNEWPTRNVRVSRVAPSFQRAWPRTFPCAAWFRAQESNLRFWIQRPASCQLDDPGVRRATCTRHTSPGRSGGNRTLTTSIKSRVRLPITLRTRADARGCRASEGGDRHERADVVGREGVEPSSLGVKARCSARLS